MKVSASPPLYRWAEGAAKLSRVRRMPGAASAYMEEEKITGYLLSLEHPDGRAKAVYFS